MKKIFNFFLGSKKRKRNQQVSDVESMPWVLCCDDYPDFRKSIQFRFAQHGVLSVRCNDGLETLRVTRDSKPSLILLDINMPSLQGDEVLERLRQHPMTMNVPVIVITGRQDSEMRCKMLAAGVAAYMTKPVDFEHLLRLASEHMPIDVTCEQRTGRIDSRHTVDAATDNEAEILEAEDSHVYKSHAIGRMKNKTRRSSRSTSRRTRVE